MVALINHLLTYLLTYLLKCNNGKCCVLFADAATAFAASYVAPASKWKRLLFFRNAGGEHDQSELCLRSTKLAAALRNDAVCCVMSTINIITHVSP